MAVRYYESDSYDLSADVIPRLLTVDRFFFPQTTQASPFGVEVLPQPHCNFVVLPLR